MTVRKGQEIQLRYDPEDLREAWCYEPSGPFIGTATLREAIGALVSDSDMVSKARLASQIQEQKGEEKLLRKMFPQRNAQSVREDLAALGAAVGAAAPQLPQSQTIRATAHDIAAAQVRREERSGKQDLERLAPAESEATTQLRWYDEPVAAAG
jgi:hypothetical protein